MKQPKRAVVSVRFTEEEFRRLAAYAASEGKLLSVFIHDAALTECYDEQRAKAAEALIDKYGAETRGPAHRLAMPHRAHVGDLRQCDHESTQVLLRRGDGAPVRFESRVNSPYVPDRRLPFLRAAIAVALSIPALVYALWEHDSDNLLRVCACLLWGAWGYWWGWQDRATTMRTSPAQSEGAERG